MRSSRKLRRTVAVLGLLLAGAGLWLLASAGWIHAKAALAQVLLERAWAETRDGAPAARPWPWADTHPVGRLQVPDLQVDQIVLAGASGRTLAFGPALLDGTAAPGGPGHTVLSGHRDTHFRFLKDLLPGSELRLQGPDGKWQSYRVARSEVIDVRNARLGPDDGRPALSLVTCWPFDSSIPGGPLRYVVFAEEAAFAARAQGL